MCHSRSGILSYIEPPDPSVSNHVEVYSLSLPTGNRMNFPERIKTVFIIREVRVLEGIPLEVVEPSKIINKIKGKQCMEKRGKQEGIVSLRRVA